MKENPYSSLGEQRARNLRMTESFWSQRLACDQMFVPALCAG